ncbi:MAG: serine protease, partial [Propioniciclava sp.]
MSAALVLDLALVALIIGRAFAGWRVGALVSLLGLVGVVAGALAGWWLAPQLLARAQLAAAGYAQTLAMMAILLVGALVGEW